MRDHVTLALLIFAALPAVISVLLHLRTPWRDTDLGRHLLVYSSVIAVVLVLAVIRRLGPWPLWFEWFRTGVFALVPLVMWWRCLIQIQVARRENRTP